MVTVTSIFDATQKDERITVWHISLYTALLHLYSESGSQNPFSITRKELMQLSHIHALATYHRCIRELEAFGYIGYAPSFHPQLGSLVYLKGWETYVTPE